MSQAEHDPDALAVFITTSRRLGQEVASEVSRLANMSDVSFSRFFRQRTGNTFIDSLTEIRLGHASRILIDSTNSIAEVAYHCGFNNISNFNRIFKKKKGCTPREFRESFSGTRIFI